MAGAPLIIGHCPPLSLHRDVNEGVAGDAQRAGIPATPALRFHLLPKMPEDAHFLYQLRCRSPRVLVPDLNKLVPHVPHVPLQLPSLSQSTITIAPTNIHCRRCLLLLAVSADSRLPRGTLTGAARGSPDQGQVSLLSRNCVSQPPTCPQRSSHSNSTSLTSARELETTAACTIFIIPSPCILYPSMNMSAH